MNKPRKKTQQIPDTLVCWSLEDWPEQCFPHTEERGRHLCREYRDALLKAGALVRIGRQLVIIGVPYLNFLKKHASRVTEFDIAPNKPEHAPKRNNGAAHIKEVH